MTSIDLQNKYDSDCMSRAKCYLEVEYNQDDIILEQFVTILQSIPRIR
jgi:hypothetical protein